MNTCQTVARYRPDIDGLRAIAVILVIIFHANSGWLASGFIGVDIFFVISGYLITGIILTQISEKRFSLNRFFISRLWR
ncbi:MAG TPA: acyltransferase, partial [Pantoea sp.]|nr:acyltransferase [Pantoea sp.]